MTKLYALLKNPFSISKIEVQEEYLKIEFSGEDIHTGDEYHSMHELYEHRMALTVALTKQIMKHYYEGVTCIRSKKHYDDTMFDGYFVVLIYEPYKIGKQITYHYKLEHWNKFEHCITQDRLTVEYDGHKSEDTIKRLMEL